MTYCIVAFMILCKMTKVFSVTSFPFRFLFRFITDIHQIDIHASFEVHIESTALPVICKSKVSKVL